jgi:hypothetical protein
MEAPEFERFYYAEGVAIAVFRNPETGEVLHKTCPARHGDFIKYPDCDPVTITGIRCERLQDISADDCAAEGVLSRAPKTRSGYCGQVCEIWEHSHPLTNVWQTFEHCSHFPEYNAVANLWSHIYPDGPKSWGANPITWAIETERKNNE